MSDALADPLEERFATAYAALELTQPGKPGNGAAAYLKARPGCVLKTAQNQAKTFLDRAHVKARVDALLLSADGADHIVHSGAFIDDLLLDTIAEAREQQDAAVMLRAAELADRGRVGGPKFVKETRNRRVDSPLSGKSPKEIEAMRAVAVRELLGVEPEELEEFIAFKKARTIEATTDGASTGEDAEGEARVGDEDRGGDAVH